MRSLIPKVKSIAIQILTHLIFHMPIRVKSPTKSKKIDLGLAMILLQDISNINICTDICPHRSDESIITTERSDQLSSSILKTISILPMHETVKANKKSPTLNPNAMVFKPPSRNAVYDKSRSVTLLRYPCIIISNLNPHAMRYYPHVSTALPMNKYATLRSLRVKNIDKILLGHVNINNLRNKSEMLADLIKGKLDIMLISETKIDYTFPTSQFDIEGYTSFRLDRTANRGGILLHTRYDIPAKKLPILGTENIECIILEITIAKKKWLLLGTYNHDISLINKHLSVLSKCICHYTPSSGGFRGGGDGEGGGKGPWPWASRFSCPKRASHFYPPPPPMHLSECPKVFGKMFQSCPRCPQNGFN